MNMIIFLKLVFYSSHCVNIVDADGPVLKHQVISNYNADQHIIMSTGISCGHSGLKLYSYFNTHWYGYWNCFIYSQWC